MAILTQAQVEQWIAQNGGPAALQYGVEKKQVRNPEYDPATNPMAPQYVDIEVEVWKNGKTNAVLTVRRQPDGNLEQIENVGADPSRPATGTNDGPPGGKPYIDEEGANGRRLGWNPATKQYDRDLGPSPSAQKGPDEKRTPITRNGKTYIQVETKKPDGTSSLHYEDQAGNKAALPDEVKEPDKPTTKQETVKGSDGKDYVRVTSTKPDGTTTIKVFGPDGKEVPGGVPGEGPSTPRVAGPKLPQIVLGASQEAARTYKEQLQQGVAAGSWSQAWADARWKEFMEVANLAVSEAATRQRNEESTRNAEINLAEQKQNAMTTGTNNALTFVNSINGLLPKGSNLGGQAFAALLGLQMLQANLSGINSIDPRAKPPAPLTPAEIADPNRLEARRAEIMANPVFKPAPPATLPVTPNQREGRGQPAQAASPPAPVTPAPPISQQARDNYPQTERGSDTLAPGLTPPAPVETPQEGIGPSEPVVVPPSGSPAPWTVAPAVPAAGYPEQPIMGPNADQTNTGPVRVVPSPTITGSREAGYPDAPIMGPNADQTNTGPVRVVPSSTVQASRDAGYPDQPMMGPNADQTNTGPIRVVPSQTVIDSRGVPVPVYPDTSDPMHVSKIMPQQEWAALSAFAPPVPVQPPPQAQPMLGGEPVAVKRARIASTPPWRLTPEDIQWSEDNGYSNEAWTVPGRVA